MSAGPNKDQDMILAYWEKSPIAMGVFDCAENGIQSARMNSRFYEVTGIGRVDDVRHWTETVHPCDRKALQWMGVKMFQGEKEREIKLRLRVKDGSYRWFGARATGENIGDGMVRVYIVFFDVGDYETARTRLEKEIAAAETLRKDILGTVYVNVTKDTRDSAGSRENSGVAYADTYEKWILDEALAVEPRIKDQKEETKSLLLSAAQTILDAEKRKEYIRRLNHFGLLEEHAAGHLDFTIEYRRKVGNGVRWVATRTVFRENPETNELMAFFYVRDIHRQKVMERVTKLTFERNSDCVLLLNAENESATMISANEAYRNIVHSIGAKEWDIIEYHKILKNHLDRIEDEETRNQFANDLSLETIQQMVNENGEYTYIYDIPEGKEIRHKEISYFYLDDLKEDIVATQRDLTSNYRKEQKHIERLEKERRRAEEERNKNERLGSMLDSVTAGIVSGYFKGHEGRFTWVNKYFCQMLGMTEDEVLGRKESGDLNDGRTEQGLLEAIPKEDLPVVFGYFMSLCEGDGKVAESVFRLKTPKEPTGQYFSCLSRTVKQKDGTYRVYSIYTDATRQMERQAEFDRIMQELLITNPNSRCAYHLNLTQNLCSDCHGATEFTQHILDAQTADELLEKVGAIVIDRDKREYFQTDCTRERLIERFEAGESKFSMIYRRKTDGRKYLWVQTFFQLMRNPQTSDVEMIAYTVDVDLQVREEELTAQLSEKEFYAYGTVDVETHRVDHYYLEAPAAGISQGMTVEGGMGNMLDRIATEEQKEDFAKHTDVDYIVGELKTKPVYSYQFTLDGRRMQVNYRYLDGMNDYLSFIIRDVTDAVAREEENARILQGALDAAEAANMAKSDFLSRMSHDIRTPLNAIIGFSNLMIQNAEDPERVRDEAGKILASGDHLLGLINDVLDMSKIESGKAQLNNQPIRLSESMRTIEGIIRPQMEEKNQKFTMDTSGVKRDRFIADSQRMRQILINILSNATKYTQEGGEISMTADEYGERSDQYDVIRFRIADNGRGMSEEYLQHVFEPFSRERAGASENIQGTGLGMAITKNLVRMMGGTIEVQSEVGRGSVFTVYLPLKEDEEGEREDAEGGNRNEVEAADITGMKFLAAEDNELNAEILTEVLKLNGAEVDVNGNGRLVSEAFRAAEPGKYDLILMDIQMPEMDGNEAARVIRAMAKDESLSEEKRAEAENIPIIAMTANAFVEDVQRALNAGMNAHVAKPLDMELLKKTIAELAGGGTGNSDVNRRQTYSI